MEKSKDQKINPIEFIEKICPVEFIEDSENAENSFSANDSNSNLLIDTIAEKETSVKLEVYEDNSDHEDYRLIKFIPKSVSKINNDSTSIKYSSQLNSPTFVDSRASSTATHNNSVSVANFDIKVNYVEQIMTAGIKKEKYFLTCTLKNGHYENIAVEKEELTNKNWVDKHLGARFVITGKYELFKLHLSELILFAPTHVRTEKIGWYMNSDGQYRYHVGNGIIPPNAALDCSGNADYTIFFDNRINDEKYCLNKTLSMLNIAKNKTYELILPVMLYVLLAILKIFFKLAGFEPRYCLGIFGETGSGKTELSKVLGCIVNREKYLHDASFFDTEASIETIISTKKDNILIVDDIWPEGKKINGKTIMEIFEFILRIFGDGKAKSRGTKNMKKNIDLMAEGLCIITGESSTTNPSSIARILGINIDKDSLDFKILAYYQQNKSIYSNFIYFFICWCSTNVNYIINYISSNFQVKRNLAINGGIHKRLIDMFVSLSIVNDLLIEYSKLKSLDESWLNFLINEANNYITKAIKDYSITSVDKQPELQFVIALIELINTNTIKLVHKDSGKPSNMNNHGYYDDDFYYLIPGEAYTAVVNYYKKQGINFFTTKSKAFQNLENLGLIEVKDDSGKCRRTIPVSIKNASLQRYLVIRKNELATYGESLEL